MKKEQKQLMIFLVQMFVLLAFAALYAIGGSEDFWGGQKWLRRWLAPAVLTVGALILARDWRYLMSYPLMAGALCLPYGADGMWEKIGLRAVFGLACALAYNMVNVLRGYITLSIFGAVLCVWASVLLGVFNPTPNAIIEQGTIAMFIGFTYITGSTKKT